MIYDYERLYAKSIRLIDSNPNLTTNNIPDDLLEVWIYNGDIVSEPPFEMLFTATIYRYANEKYGDLTIDATFDRQRFRRFQHIIATEYICRQVGAKLRPRRIFDFARDNDPLSIDIKRHQMKRFKSLAAKLAPFHTPES